MINLNILRNTIYIPFCFGIIFLFPIGIKAQDAFDSLEVKLPKHYFNTVIVLDAYYKPNKKLNSSTDEINKRLKSYGVKQFGFSFHAPLYTKDKTNKDNSIRNTHLLLTGNFLSLQPSFDGISKHNLIKFGIGMRFIYNTGEKGVWFVDVSPFVTRDIAYPKSSPYYRLASTIVYSHNFNDKFNLRLGVTKSFMWGNRLYLPFIGLRIGRLDKINLSIQFPRNVSLNIPMGSKIFFSLYSKVQGGMFNFSNADSLYAKYDVGTFHFTRSELNSGFRFDFRVSKNFNFYLASGLSTRNNITFYSENANKTLSGSYNKYFYSEKVPASLFFNFGLVLKLGKTRAYYNNKNILDAANMNSTLDNNGNGNVQIPLTPRKKSDFNLKSIQDLVDYNDF
ncbi:hypothetical protein [Aurantibacillus circumpalustris]|uniref:hypothetical protein n=1 Tax=Aurantibacillus circumpalustris TaxID=3036359 RepID=UPI00295B2B4B|nr:hypothetical protein [Aurantibacillus circumpalustris]